MADRRIAELRAWRLPAGSVLALSLLLSCAPYQPAPVDQAALTAAYNARGLDDPGLQGYLSAAGLDPATTGWQARDLALAAWYWSPALDRARAARTEAIASQITAGTRPQPGLAVGVEKDYSGGGGEPPWGVSGTLAFTFELGGKRGARIARSQARTFLAEEEVSLVAWQEAMDVRRMADRLASAELKLGDVRAELRALRTLDSVLKGRYREGVVTRSDLAQNEAELQGTLVERGLAQRELREAMAGMAASVGVVPAQLDTLKVMPPQGSWCTVAATLPRDSLQSLVVRSRPEVGVALAGYSVAEADVRVEIARQYPDITLGPGLFFDHGINKWTVLFALPTIPFHRNRGPIAESEARRGVAAAQVAVVQDSALADLDVGLERCSVTTALQASADSLFALIQERADRAQAAYDRGETSRLELAFLDLARVRAERTRHAADQQRREAGTLLEAAAGVWRSDPPSRWPNPANEPRGNPPLKDTLP